MSKQEIASLACKILGIYMIIQGINAIANVFTVYIVTPQPQFINYLGSISSFVFLLIFGIMLWPLSDKLAVIMLKGEPHYCEESGLKAGDIQRVSFSVLGLLLLGNSIPKLVSEIVNFYTMRGIPNSTARIFSSQGVAGSITQFFLGLGIFLGSQGLVNFLYAIRNAGLSRERDLNDKE